MQITDGQFNSSSLTQFGKEVIDLFKCRDFNTLAVRFGYALAYDREPYEAIKEDLNYCFIRADGRSPITEDIGPEIEVKFFSKNTIGLEAVIECLIEMIEGLWIEVDLVVIKNGQIRNLSIEDITYLA
jgi:hypothetical protein